MHKLEGVTKIFKNYSLFSKQSYHDSGYSISPVQEEYIQEIREWRNAQLDVLRQSSEITSEQQARYFEKNIWPDMEVNTPTNILMVFMHQGSLIGYGGLVHISWLDFRAEVSFLLNPGRVVNQESYLLDFTMFLRLIKGLAFEELHLNRIFTETYDIRPIHIKALEDAGFLKEGIMREHGRIDGLAVDSILHGCLRSYER